MWAIYKRELKAFFTSAIAYIYLTVFCLITGYVFVASCLMGASNDMSSVFGTVFTVMMVLLPLVTMRLMSDEKKQRTDQGLLTAPVSLNSIVLGKFFAALTVFVVGMLIYVMYAVILKSVAGSISFSSYLGNMLGLLLLGAAFISIGLFVSTLTELQIVAAIGTFAINLLLYISDIIASSISWEPLKQVFMSIGFYSRYNEFTQGILDVTSVLYFVSVVFVFNFLTVRTLEKRRWS